MLRLFALRRIDEGKRPLTRFFWAYNGDQAVDLWELHVGGEPPTHYATFEVPSGETERDGGAGMVALHAATYIPLH